MRSSLRTMILAGVLAIGGLVAFGPTPVQAQGFGVYLGGGYGGVSIGGYPGVGYGGIYPGGY